MKHEHLPEGWRWIKLGDVLEQQYRQEILLEGTDYTTLGVRWYAGGTFIKQERDGDDISASYLNRVEEGDFIYNRLFAWKGSFAIVPAEHAGYHVSNEFPVFKIKAPDQVDLDYLLWYTKRTHFWEYIATLSTGTSNASRLRYKEDDLLRESIPLPPIDEQRRIAEALRDADASIACVEAQITAAQQVKRGVMQRLFMYGLAGEGTPTKHTRIGEIPETWEVVPVGALATVSSGSTPSRSNPEYWKDGNIAWVKTGEVNYDIIYDTEEKITVLALNEVGLRVYEPGTILMAMYGQGVTRGKVALLGIAATINQACAAISVNGNVVSEFLLQYLTFRYDEIRKLSHGSNQTNLNGQLVAGLLTPVPSLREQREIAAILSDHDVTIRSLKAEAASLREVKRGLMQKLLSGEVRV